MREEFEKLPQIAKMIPKDNAFMFSEEDNCYFDYDDTRRIEGFINGSWYAFQEQQKKIDKAIEYLDSIEGLVWYEQIKELLK